MNADNENIPDLNQDIDYSRRGPWDTPLPSFNKSKTPIKVLVYDLRNENGDIENKFDLDYSSYDDRKFLGRLTYWALTTGRSIETMLVTEWEKMK